MKTSYKINLSELDGHCADVEIAKAWNNSDKCAELDAEIEDGFEWDAGTSNYEFNRWYEKNYLNK